MIQTNQNKKEILCEKTLVEILQEDIRNTDKETIKIQSGHLPMLYFDEGGNQRAQVDVNRWGEFSKYSFELGCQLAAYAKSIGKTVGLLVMADDIVELPRDNDGNKKMSKWTARVAKAHYKKNSLPEEYSAIMDKYNVADSIVYQRRSFGCSKLISERTLKFEALATKLNAPNECSMAYNAMLNDNDLVTPEKDYLISIVPGQCRGNLCTGVLDVRKDIDASHVFFPHIEQMGGIVDMGEGYVTAGQLMKVSEIYDVGLTYVKNQSCDKK